MAAPSLSRMTDIDHSRLAGELGVSMPPAHVLLVSEPALEAEMVAANPLLAIELPLRALAYETADGKAAVTYNEWAYIESRYQLDGDAELGQRYAQAMDSLLTAVPAESIVRFADNNMAENGIISLQSDYDFETSIERVRAAINAQDDTVWFGEIDYQAVAADQGLSVLPARLLLFGGPGPGGKAMAEAPTLGLDAFCQKLLVWEDQDGVVRISFIDLLALADRQGVKVNPALRLINFRLNREFEGAARAD